MKKVWWGRIRKPIWKWCQLGNKCFRYDFFVQAMRMPRSKNSSGVYRPKYKNLRTFFLSRSAHVPDPGQVYNLEIRYRKATTQQSVVRRAQ